MQVVVDPVIKDGSYRVIRGGSWSHYGQSCRAANRIRYTPSSRNVNLGFRVVVEIPNMKALVDPFHKDTQRLKAMRGGSYLQESGIYLESGFQGQKYAYPAHHAVGFRIIVADDYRYGIGSKKKNQMHLVESLLLNLVHEPNDILTWHVLADALEEVGRNDEAQLCRATIDIRYTYGPDTEEHGKSQAEVQELIKAGIKPCWPTVVVPHDMRYSVIPSGGFLMGESKTPVAITKPFLMSQTQVTQAQWFAVMGANPSHFQGSGYPDHMNYPVESVSWHVCQAFCKKLTEATGLVHRLPTEAEWEYACRAGTTTAYHQGDSEEDLKLVGHYKSNNPIAVGSLLPNAFGLYDMHGNVWEWCQDGHHSNLLEGQEVMEVTEEEWKSVRTAGVTR